MINPHRESLRRRDGAIMFVAMALIALISLVAAALVSVNVAEFKGGVYNINAEKAFYNAEGGMNYVINRINKDIAAGVFSLMNETASVINVSYSRPSSSYSFDPVTRLERVNDMLWVFSVTGTYGNSKSAIEVCVRRDRLGFGDIGVFGGNSVVFQPNVSVYSYRSTDTLEPTPADSTGEGNVGSNGSISFWPGVVVDGILKVGTDEFGVRILPTAGYTWEAVERIDPDPLGCTNGPLAEAFIAYSLTNDNASAGIAGNVLSVGNHGTFTLDSGIYYLNSLTMATHSTLNINATRENPVVIFLRGKLDVGSQPTINLNSKLPTAFYIFSDYTGEHDIQPGADFYGFIYSPLASLKVWPNGNLFGAFWGRAIEFKPAHAYATYLDQSIADQFLSATVSIAQWRRL